MIDSSVRRIQEIVNELNQSEGLPCRELLSGEQIKAAWEGAGVAFRKRVYDPVVTLWAFLSQVLAADPNCQSAVDRINAQRLADGKKAASSDTSSYCKARRRLSETMLARLAKLVGREVEDQGSKKWLWHGHHVKVVDGSTSRMPDTEENRAEFRQPSSQQAGLGFPQLRMVVVFSLSVATVLDAAIGACEGKGTGETSLFRKLWDVFSPGDIVLGDCLYDSFRDVAALRARNVDVVFRMNQSRRCDFRRGTRLGKNDHIVIWKKPKFDRCRFDRATYDALPDTLMMRELRFRVEEPHCRSKMIVVVTTLLNATLYSKKDIANLFRERWHAELDLRCLKPVMGLDELRCKTPEMVRREFWMHLLAYNLLRKKMAQAAKEHDRTPRRLSFKGALNALRSYAPKLATEDEQLHANVQAQILRTIASRTVGDRPNRYEPRAKKRRNGPYPYLTRPREELRQAFRDTGVEA